jgi:hypothetical protein
MRTLNCVQLLGVLGSADGRPTITTERWQRGADGQQHRVADVQVLAPATQGVRVLLDRLPAGTRCFVEGPLATGRGGVQNTPPAVLVHTLVPLADPDSTAGHIPTGASPA